MFRKLERESVQQPSVTITIDGVSVAAEVGESIAAVLLRTDPYFARTSAVEGQPRAPYCMMGACFDCLVEVDGVASTRSCLTQVREGLVVRRRVGLPDPLNEVAA